LVEEQAKEMANKAPLVLLVRQALLVLKVSQATKVLKVLKVQLALQVLPAVQSSSTKTSSLRTQPRR
jgi:hypothetical protein